MKLAKSKRANKSQIALRNLVASKIRQAGAVPRRNRQVDLVARISQDIFIFKMKSIESNIPSQIRSGVSQLYEYRYLQGVPDANLVLVIEKPLSRGLLWLEDYLLHDRGILLVWDGDGDRLHCSDTISDKLQFLL